MFHSDCRVTPLVLVPVYPDQGRNHSSQAGRHGETSGHWSHLTRASLANTRVREMITGGHRVFCRVRDIVTTRFVVITCHSYICDLLALLLYLLRTIVMCEGSHGPAQYIFPQILATIQTWSPNTLHINPNL